MKKIFLFCLSYAILFYSFTQNLAINNTGTPANPNAILDVDISTNNKGILIPRLTTAQRTGITGLGLAEDGLWVYDETLNNFWYWDGTQWVSVLYDNTGWKTLGNAGTSAATNFLGTTDAVPMIMRTNNTEQLRITPTGLAGMGLNNPFTQLDIQGALTLRETMVGVASNTVNIPANISQVRVTGTPTAMITVNAPAAPNPGQRLLIYNNTNTTSGWRGAELGEYIVPSSEALDFVYTSGKWVAISNPSYDDGSMITNGDYLLATGGLNANFGLGGWTDNTVTPVTLLATTDPNTIYNTTNGEATIEEHGLYAISSSIRLNNDLGLGSTFDGTSGEFISILQVQRSGSGVWENVAMEGRTIYRGVTVPGGQVTYRIGLSCTLLLKPGDKVRLAFMTLNAANMNSSTINTFIDKIATRLRILRG